MTIILGLVVPLGALIAGLFLLEIGADRFTGSIGRLARRLRASESTVGLLTAGGEWEELVVVVLALAGGHAGLAVGNVVGSCLANLLGSLPLGFLGKQTLKVDRSARIYAMVMLAVTALAGVFLAGPNVPPIAGGVLVAVFLVYLGSVVLVIRRGWLRPLDDDDDDDGDERAADHDGRRVALPGVLGLVGALLVGFALISVGAELIVDGAVTVARGLSLSDYAIGATVVAIGTTLPDKAISFVAGRRGRGGVVAANATGSNIFLLTLVLGLAALLSRPALPVPSLVARADLPLLLVASVLIVGLFFWGRLNRIVGIGLLTLYVGYLAYALARGG